MGIEISKKAIVNVSADRLWSILADDFDKIGEWARMKFFLSREQQNQESP